MQPTNAPVAPTMQDRISMDMLLSSYQAMRIGWRFTEGRRLDELPGGIGEPTRAVGICLRNDASDSGDIHP